MNLKKLKDAELINSAKTLVGSERNVIADFLLHLIEIEGRDLHLSQGYSSMFDYLTRGLKYSEPAAARRLRAARCLRENPKAEFMLRKGELNLTTLCQASSVVKQEGVFIEQFSGVSSRRAEVIAAQYKPAPKKKLKDRVKPIGRRVAESGEFPLLDSTVGADSSKNNDLASLKSEVKHEVRFEAGEEFAQKLEEVRAVLSNKLGAGASLEEVLGVCMEICLEKHCQKRKEARRVKRKAKVEKKTQSQTQKKQVKGRRITEIVKTKVMQRDQYQCSFVGVDGKKCGCREQLEIDHIVPFAVGGGSELDNLRVLCRPHNAFAARVAFGSGVIKNCVARSNAA